MVVSGLKQLLRIAERDRKVRAFSVVYLPKIRNIMGNHQQLYPY